MSFVTKTDNKNTGKDGISSNSTAKSISNEVPAAEEFDLKCVLKGWCKTSQQFFDSWKNYRCSYCDSDQMKEFNSKRQEFADTVCHPMGDFYRSFPTDFTDYKFKTIQQYSRHERLFGLQGLTLMVAIGTLRTRKQFGITQRFLFSLRNSILTFTLGGLFLVPEIYNPLIKSDF